MVDNNDDQNSSALEQAIANVSAAGTDFTIDDDIDAALSTNVASNEEQKVEQKETQERKQHHAIQELSINLDAEPSSGEAISLPSNFENETRKAIDKAPNVDMLDNPTSREWARVVSEGMELNTMAEVFVGALEDEKAEFKHNNNFNNISLNGSSPKFKPVEGQNLKGQRAVVRMINHLGIGTLFQTPLWHSGFWITFMPPTESEIVELNRLLIADKIKFGRYSFGLAFSNTTSYTTDRLVDFALSHVYDTTAKSEEINSENIRKHISSQDIPSLLWGFICTMYPKGFKYRRACVADPDKCNHILEEVLNVTKLQWSNMNALTDVQKAHMSSRQAKSKDFASIKRYKEDLVKIQNYKLEINKGMENEISFILKTPSIEEYINAGHSWIGSVVETVERAVQADASSNEREAIITRHSQATAMRNYNHWVQSIECDTNIIDDPETIEKTLNVLSSDDVIRTKFIEGVVDYINNSTISVIGIPVHDCPKCGKDQPTSLDKTEFKNIIPLDVIQLFFVLHTQRLEKITTR